jgi:hypothetical protein
MASRDDVTALFIHTQPCPIQSPSVHHTILFLPEPPTITPILLGLVHGLVGLGQELVERKAILCQYGSANADGDGNVLAIVQHWRTAHNGVQAVGKRTKRSDGACVGSRATNSSPP